MKNRSNTIESISVFVILNLICLGIMAPLASEAHYADIALSGFGTPTIDGVMSPEEWEGAGRIDYLASIPPHDGGGTTPATLFVMNDETNIYIALKILRVSFGGATNPVFEFDNDHNGVWPEEGDDGFGMDVGTFTPATFSDSFRTTQPPCPGEVCCGLGDTDFGGTSDGTSAATNDDEFTYIEISHPLNSNDDLHDFSLNSGDVVGFHHSLRLFSLDLLCYNGPDCYADTEFPPLPFFGDIVIAEPPPPGEATLVSPSGTVNDTTPTYTWYAVPTSTWYHLWVNDQTGNKINQWYTRGEAGCAAGTGTCSVTPTTEVIGSCQWWVQTYNSSGFGPWSSPLLFTSPATPPTAATQVSPSGTINDTTPTYMWNAVSNSTWYCLYVNDSTGNRINQWYTAAQAGCGSGIGACSVTPTSEVRGAGQWWVRTYNSAGYGPWSTGLLFTAPTPMVAPSAATQISPTGTISDTTPTYTWNAVINATWYCLYVNDVTGNRINQWYAAADVGCADGVGTCSVTPTTEVGGAGIWYVRTYNSGGLGPWSLPGMSFTAPTPMVAPPAATQVSPTGTINDTTPTYTWIPVANATWYQLWVGDSRSNKINQWYAAADVGCADGVGTCSVTPTAMVLGPMIWYIQTYNRGGLGPWSLPGMSFTVSP